MPKPKKTSRTKKRIVKAVKAWVFVLKKKPNIADDFLRIHNAGEQHYYSFVHSPEWDRIPILITPLPHIPSPTGKGRRNK